MTEQASQEQPVIDTVLDPESGTAVAVDEARLRRGLVADYGDYYACTAVIRFRRLEDKETVHLQFVRIAIEEDAGLMVTIEP